MGSRGGQELSKEGITLTKKNRRVQNIPLPLAEAGDMFPDNLASENDKIIILNKPHLEVTALMTEIVNESAPTEWELRQRWMGPVKKSQNKKSKKPSM